MRTGGCSPRWVGIGRVRLPSSLATLDTSILERAVDAMVPVEGRWGFKDPRSMFLLPAWADVIESFQFVGVYRPTEDVAASLVRRDGFAAEDALAIALRYNERLRFLHDEWGFRSFGTAAPDRT